MTSTFSWRREEVENWKLMEGRDKKRRRRKAGGRVAIWGGGGNRKRNKDKDRKTKEGGRQECITGKDGARVER